MITGIVTEEREAILRIIMRDARDREHSYDAVIDTGYTNTLTLPPDIINALGLRWHRFGRANLADGSESDFNVYRGIIVWDGHSMTIDVDEMDAEPLVGMSLMYGYELLMPILDGATFTLRRLTNP